MNEIHGGRMANLIMTSDGLSLCEYNFLLALQNDPIAENLSLIDTIAKKFFQHVFYILRNEWTTLIISTHRNGCHVSYGKIKAL